MSFDDWYDRQNTRLPENQLQAVRFCWMHSLFCRRQLESYPQWLGWLGSSLCGQPESEAELLDVLSETDGKLVSRNLRLWRNRHQLMLIARDINRLCSTRELTAEASRLAGLVLRCSSDWICRNLLQPKFGSPQMDPETGKPQELYIIALGKLGAGELNLSSDVDLMFAFPGEGQTSGPRQISHSEYFIHLGRNLVQLLDTHTPEGFVYRIDLRLRPWGQSGPLAVTFGFLDNYYREQGRDWERYAMIKAGVVTGSEPRSGQLYSIFRDFVYRRYIDFQALEALRDMKRMISRDVRKQGKNNNIKLGDGGIREIEFIAQAVQMIRGHQDPDLQDANIWNVFEVIRNNQYLPVAVTDELERDYNFLRNAEHALQARADKQTQTLPADEDGWQSLAACLQLENGEQAASQIAACRSRVAGHFAEFISSREDAGEEDLQHWQAIWQQQQWGPLGEGLAPLVAGFHDLPAVQNMQAEGRVRLDQLMPVLLKKLSLLPDPVTVWLRLQPVLEAVLRRSVYFLMLNENPGTPALLLQLISLSPWLATVIRDKPYLLDELCDSNAVFSLPSRSELGDDLHTRLIRLPEDDLEQQLEVLRHFRHGRVLRAAACELTGILPLMKISDYLAHIAEAVVEQSFWLTWRQMTARFGRPVREEDCSDPGFIIVGYGKLGGLELSYESDLDMVFIHDAPFQKQTEGPKQIDNTLFFTRFGQKLIHTLSTMTASGALYEVDLRLRPSGSKGPLVSSLKAFARYQQEDAWTWEHQALVRARFICGDDILRRQFEALRHEILSRSRNLPELQQDVCNMREKMRSHLSSAAKHPGSGPVFNLKQDSGGIVDIEFMVQYGVLAWARFRPELTRWTDNVRLIESLREVGFFSPDQAEALLSAYLRYRETAHSRMLQAEPTTLWEAELLAALQPVRQSVELVWQQIMLSEPRMPD